MGSSQELTSLWLGISLPTGVPLLPTILLYPKPWTHSHCAPGCAGDMWGAEPLGLMGTFPQRPRLESSGSSCPLGAGVCVQGIRPWFRTGGPHLGDPSEALSCQGQP